MVRFMHLTTHGNIIALTIPGTGLAVLLAPDDKITDADWLDAIQAHDLPKDPIAWDYAEVDGWCAWVVAGPVPRPVSRVSAGTAGQGPVPA